jgi:hypothetical protein
MTSCSSRRGLRMALMRSTTAALTWMKHRPRSRCVGRGTVWKAARYFIQDRKNKERR